MDTTQPAVPCGRVIYSSGRICKKTARFVLHTQAGVMHFCAECNLGAYAQKMRKHIKPIGG